MTPLLRKIEAALKSFVQQIFLLFLVAVVGLFGPQVLHVVSDMFRNGELRLQREWFRRDAIRDAGSDAIEFQEAAPPSRPPGSGQRGADVDDPNDPFRDLRNVNPADPGG